MKPIQITHSLPGIRFSGLVAVALGAFLSCPICISATDTLIPVKVRGVLTIESIIPIGGNAEVITVLLSGSDRAHGTHFGINTGTFSLMADIDAVTGLPLRGAGEIHQVNADGSTLTWETSFEGTETTSVITGGTGRFKNASGWVTGPSILNEDGTVSYHHEGQMAPLGAR